MEREKHSMVQGHWGPSSWTVARLRVARPMLP